MRYIILFVLPVLLSCGQAKVKELTIEGKKTKPIAGINPTDIHDKFTRKGFKFDKDSAADFTTWTSVENNENHEFKVVTTATATGKVLSVQGSIFSMLTLDQAAKDFIDLVTAAFRKLKHKWSLRFSM